MVPTSPSQDETPPDIDPIDMLAAEHSLIEQTYQALETYAGRLEEGEQPPREDLMTLVKVLGQFAERIHHPKEALLFAALADCTSEKPQIDQLLSDHDKEMQLMHALEESTRARTPWSHPHRARVIEAAYAYVDHLRGHLFVENGVVFPMARNALGVEATAALRAQFTAFQQPLAELCSQLMTEAEALLQAYGISGDWYGPRGWTCIPED